MAKSEKEAPMVERVAAALYDHAVARAKKEIDDLKFDPRDIVDVARKTIKESDTAAAIVFCSYLESKTIDLFQLHMHPFSNKEERDDMIGFNGVFGTFSSRINAAYSLKWISLNLKKSLHAVRKVRNMMAHDAYRLSFTDEDVAAHIRNIDVDVDVQLAALNKTSDDEKWGARIRSDLNERERFMFKMVYITGRTFIEMLSGPIISINRVDPRSVIDGYDTMPEACRVIHRAMAGAVVEMFEVPAPSGSQSSPASAT